jgi:radical SAM protein with 4Fe4S-binding SPASM domain
MQNMNEDGNIYYRLKNHSRNFYYALKNYSSDNPKSIDIELSNQCNLHCKMCWFHGKSGIGNKYRDQELETSEIFHLIDQVAEYKPRIYLGGSEPFIRQDLIAILKHIKNRDLTVSFPTNGTLMNLEKIAAIVDMKVDDIKISIDGNEGLHDYIRGDGVFKKATTAVKELAKYRRQSGNTKPKITINTTITNNLIGQLQETIDNLIDATDNEADCYRIHHLWFITKNELAKHQSITKQVFGAHSLGASGHIITEPNLIQPEILAYEINKLKTSPKIEFYPEFQFNDIINYYSEDLQVKQRCYAPFFGVVIKPNGDMKFCPDEWIDDYIIGNIRQDNFNNLWNSEKSRLFRKELLKQRCFPACKRCSWMYSY